MSARDLTTGRTSGERLADQNRFWPSAETSLIRTGHGVSVRRTDADEWLHPWEVTMDFEEDEWRATIEPGFVNGLPAYLDMPAEWLAGQVSSGRSSERDFGINPLTGKAYFSDWVFRAGQTGKAGGKASGSGGPVRLTNSPRPYLTVKEWRNPLAASSVMVSGDSVVAISEGYPRFFEELGVKPAEGRRELFSAAKDKDDDPSRNREIRAADLVLVQPRIGSAIDATVNSAGMITGQSMVTYSVRSVNTYMLQSGGRTKIHTTAKHQPMAYDPTLEANFGLKLAAGDPGFEELLMSTIWMVSPPFAGEDDKPDGTWDAYVEHRVFWNMAFAVPSAQGLIGDISPLTVPMIGGVAQPLLSSALSLLNTMNEEALAFLAQTNTKGIFWNI